MDFQTYAAPVMNNSAALVLTNIARTATNTMHDARATASRAVSDRKNKRRGMGAKRTRMQMQAVVVRAMPTIRLREKT